MKIPFFLRKFLGVGMILTSAVIFLYLGWYYFVMPQLVSNEKSSLSKAFELGMFSNTKRNDNVKEGIIIGGVLYPWEYSGTTSTSSAIDIDHHHREPAFLTIPELGIKDRIIEFNVDGTRESIYSDVLTRAVAHFAGTAYPGLKGNFVLFGHSKIPILAGSDYESVFTNLPRLRNGAIVEIKQSDVKYRYRVNYTAVLSPKDVFILNQPENERILTLMTCIPPGFGSDRFVAVGNLIGVAEV